MDQSSIGLEKANNLADENGVEISTIVADLTDYDLGNEIWDGIVSISAHVPLELRKKLHRQVVDALKRAGVFILEAYTVQHIEMNGIGGPPPSSKEMFMSLSELESELKGLEFLVGAEIERSISEGKYHQGESAVVQIVGCKTA